MFNMKKLSESDFLQVVENAPLVALDILLQDTASEKFLVGYRTNDPAKDTWFVPGGRIYKDETMTAALERIFKEELGITQYTGAYQVMGVSDHMYDTCFYKADPSYTNTHYVVIAVKVQVDKSLVRYHKMMEQHSDCKWMSVLELLHHPDVHSYTKRHFHTNLLQGTLHIQERGVSLRELARSFLRSLCRMYSYYRGE